MSKHDKAYFALMNQQQALRDLQRALRLADGVEQAKADLAIANAALEAAQEEARNEARQLSRQ